MKMLTFMDSPLTVTVVNAWYTTRKVHRTMLVSLMLRFVYYKWDTYGYDVASICGCNLTLMTSGINKNVTCSNNPSGSDIVGFVEETDGCQLDKQFLLLHWHPSIFTLYYC